jgi:hypothetical protein
MYSDMSKRSVRCPAIGQLLGDFGLADAGRAGEQEGADRLARIAEAGARHLDRLGQRVDGLVLAEDGGLQVAVEVLQRAAVVGDTCCDGMRAILATISSISVLPMTFFCFDLGRMRCAAPASSMTSMALSGRWRSVM